MSKEIKRQGCQGSQALWTDPKPPSPRVVSSSWYRSLKPHRLAQPASEMKRHLPRGKGEAAVDSWWSVQSMKFGNTSNKESALAKWDGSYWGTVGTVDTVELLATCVDCANCDTSFCRSRLPVAWDKELLQTLLKQAKRWFKVTTLKEATMNARSHNELYTIIYQ